MVANNERAYITFVVGVGSLTSVQGSSKRMLDTVLLPCRNRKTPCEEQAVELV